MTDKDLLELAAKAACRCVDHENSCDDALFVQHEKFGEFSMWNPLNDDGDALRLAVDLNIDVHPKWGSDDVVTYIDGGQSFVEAYNNDKHAATRRAIVRAAAAIGASL